MNHAMLTNPHELLVVEIVVIPPRSKSWLWSDSQMFLLDYPDLKWRSTYTDLSTNGKLI